MKAKTAELLDENIRESLYYLIAGKDFRKHWLQKKKYVNWTSLKLRVSVYQKIPLRK